MVSTVISDDLTRCALPLTSLTLTFFLTQLIYLTRAICWWLILLIWLIDWDCNQTPSSHQILCEILWNSDWLSESFISHFPSTLINYRSREGKKTNTNLYLKWTKQLQLWQGRWATSLKVRGWMRKKRKKMDFRTFKVHHGLAQSHSAELLVPREPEFKLRCSRWDLRSIW